MFKFSDNPLPIAMAHLDQVGYCHSTILLGKCYLGKPLEHHQHTQEASRYSEMSSGIV